VVEGPEASVCLLEAGSGHPLHLYDRAEVAGERSLIPSCLICMAQEAVWASQLVLLPFVLPFIGLLACLYLFSRQWCSKTPRIWSYSIGHRGPSMIIDILGRWPKSIGIF